MAAPRHCATRSRRSRPTTSRSRSSARPSAASPNPTCSSRRRRRRSSSAFNVRADAAARGAIKESGVDIRYYSIIYEAIDDIKAAVERIAGARSPRADRRSRGSARGVPLAEVRQRRGLHGGRWLRSAQQSDSRAARQRRDLRGAARVAAPFQGRRSEVRAGTECGIGVRNYNDVKAGDQIECYERTEIARNPGLTNAARTYQKASESPPRSSGC